MSTKYLTNVGMILLGGLVVVLSKSLNSATAVAWSAFGVAIAMVAISMLFQLDSRRGIAQRLLDLAVISVAGTLIGTSVVFAGTTVMWLAFALGLGVVGAAVVGLTLHEIETWRSAHGIGQLQWLRPEYAVRGEETAPRREEVGTRAA